ncbi:VC0807 family protein [Nocardioides sp. AN3]
MPAVITRVVVTLATAVLVPAVLLWATMQLFDVTTAVVVALSWMAALMGWRHVTGRPVSGLLLLSLGVLTVKTAFTLVTGNTFVYFVQPVFADVAVSAIFLGSLVRGRPVIARLAPEFYPMSAALAARPEVCALFRRLTLMWGLVILGKAAITWWLLEALSTAAFVLIKGGAIITLTTTAATVTIVWAYVVVRRQGLPST